ncbi:hypothetical protein L6R50_18005 [Myxococcota bacterium]|nr:hypothetical protein [Myxococcota bacterium]
MSGVESPGGRGIEDAAAGRRFAADALVSLVPGYAHDLNNVIGGVMGLVSALLTAPSLAPDVREDLEAVRDAVRRGRGLVARLAAVGGTAPDPPVALDPAETFREAAKPIRRSTRCVVAVTSVPGTPRARAPAAAAERIAAHVLARAEALAGPGGRIGVAVGPEEREGAEPGVLLALRAESTAGPVSLDSVLSPDLVREAEAVGGTARARGPVIEVVFAPDADR